MFLIIQFLNWLEEKSVKNNTAQKSWKVFPEYYLPEYQTYNHIQLDKILANFRM